MNLLITNNLLFNFNWFQNELSNMIINCSLILLIIKNTWVLLFFCLLFLYKLRYWKSAETNYFFTIFIHLRIIFYLRRTLVFSLWIKSSFPKICKAWRWKAYLVFLPCCPCIIFQILEILFLILIIDESIRLILLFLILIFIFLFYNWRFIVKPNVLTKVREKWLMFRDLILDYLFIILFIYSLYLFFIAFIVKIIEKSWFLLFLILSFEL